MSIVTGQIIPNRRIRRIHGSRLFPLVGHGKFVADISQETPVGDHRTGILGILFHEGGVALAHLFMAAINPRLEFRTHLGAVGQCIQPPFDLIAHPVIQSKDGLEFSLHRIIGSVHWNRDPRPFH